MAVTPHGSEAYDLSLFESRKGDIVALKPNKKQQKEQQRRARMQAFFNVVAVALVAVAMVTVVGLMIAGRVQLTEMNTEVNQLKEQLSSLQSETVTLKNDLATKTSAESVEAYVEANGMQKTESYQIRYISVQSGDRIEKPAQENQPWYQSLMKWLENLF